MTMKPQPEAVYIGEQQINLNGETVGLYNIFFLDGYDKSTVTEPTVMKLVDQGLINYDRVIWRHNAR